ASDSAHRPRPSAGRQLFPGDGDRKPVLQCRHGSCRPDHRRDGGYHHRRADSSGARQPPSSAGRRRVDPRRRREGHHPPAGAEAGLRWIRLGLPGPDGRAVPGSYHGRVTADGHPGRDRRRRRATSGRL
ncbi:MAG: RidA/YER057c/UK114 superfamily protein, partial [uncultured Propionibacteriaceae bacterium]